MRVRAFCPGIKPCLPARCNLLTSPSCMQAPRHASAASRLNDVYVVSDLHSDHAANLQWVRELKACPHATLVVAGDVSNDITVFRDTMTLLKQRFAHVFFVVGNHELWLKDGGDEADSISKLHSLMELCDELGVLTRPARLGQLAIVPILSWHHQSWDTEPDIPGIPKAGRLMIMDYQRCRWPCTPAGAATADDLQHPGGHGALSTALRLDAWNDSYSLDRTSTSSLQNAANLPSGDTRCPEAASGGSSNRSNSCNTGTNTGPASSQSQQLPVHYDNSLGSRHCKVTSAVPTDINISNDSNITRDSTDTAAQHTQSEAVHTVAVHPRPAASGSTDTAWAAVLQAVRGCQVLSFSHFLPRQELLPEKRFLAYPNLSKVVGSVPLEKRVRQLSKVASQHVHVFGHSHFAWDSTVDGVRYVQAPLCYPLERQRRRTSLTLSSAWQSDSIDTTNTDVADDDDEADARDSSRGHKPGREEDCDSARTAAAAAEDGSGRTSTADVQLVAVEGAHFEQPTAPYGSNPGQSADAKPQQHEDKFMAPSSATSIPTASPQEADHIAHHSRAAGKVKPAAVPDIADPAARQLQQEVQAQQKQHARQGGDADWLPLLLYRADVASRDGAATGAPQPKMLCKQPVDATGEWEAALDFQPGASSQITGSSSQQDMEPQGSQGAQLIDQSVMKQQGQLVGASSQLIDSRVLDCSGGFCPRVQAAWSMHYEQHARTANVLELAPWVAKRYDRLIRRAAQGTAVQSTDASGTA